MLKKILNKQATLNTKAYLWGVKNRQTILNIFGTLKDVKENTFIMLSALMDMLGVIICLTFIVTTLFGKETFITKLFVIIILIHIIIMLLTFLIERMQHVFKLKGS